jgi:hypothetical protein
MTVNPSGQAPKAAVAATILLALSTGAAPPAALAQAPKASVGNVETATGSVTIKSIDRENRRMVVTDESGESFSLKVPAEVQSFDQLKPGDTIKASYTLETEYVLSAPNAALPADSETRIAARAAKGELPAGVVANHIIVTGAVVGVDRTRNTLKLVSPQGGEVYTIAVRSADGLKAMDKVKVGDKITAYVTESMVIAVNP